jgi:hypothetical protein
MRRYIVITAVLACFASNAISQTLHWEPVNGPALAIPSLIGVNSNGHVDIQLKNLWWTSDDGQHWHEYAINAAIRDSSSERRTLLTFSRSGKAFVS